ncbi:MAG TPA: hypothetical protein DIS81_06185 [Psychrobacter sp.]|nr:hypothetical protein [Psychrobacter sp.]
MSDKNGKSDKEDKSGKDDKYGAMVTNIYQWASKLKDEFKSDASNVTHDVSEKAVALILNKLLEGVDAELEAFDKKVEDSKEPVENAEEKRRKMTDRKEKYQSMIEQLES